MQSCGPPVIEFEANGLDGQYKNICFMEKIYLK